MKILIIDGIDYKTGLANLGLGFLLQYIRDNHDIKVVSKAYNSDIDIIETAADFDIFGFSCLTSQYPHCIALANKLKDKYPDVPIVFGGIHATSAPEIVIENSCVDFVCIGESEISFESLLNALSSPEKNIKEVPGICYRDGDNNIIFNECKVIDDLDLIGIPALDLLEYAKNSLKTNVITSRSCPFTCTYCYNSTMREKFKHKYRRRSVESVIEECLYHKINNKVYIAFSDDLFLSNEEWLMNFADHYGAKIGIPFGVSARPEAVLKHEKSLRALKKIGLFDVWIGIESGNERIRREILNRKMSNGDIIAAFNKIHELGMVSKSYNIVGIPTEGFKEAIDTFLINFKCKPNYTSYYTLIPYPGTKILKLSESLGLLESADYSDKGNIQSEDVVECGMLSTGKMDKYHIVGFRYLWMFFFKQTWLRLDKKIIYLINSCRFFIAGTVKTFVNKKKKIDRAT